MEMIDNKLAVGIDVGGSHVSSAVIDVVTGEMVGDVCTTPLDSKGCASEILDAFEENVKAAVMASGAGAVRNVGFAFPGPFDYVRGVSTVHGVDKYEHIYGLDIRASLAPRLAGLGVEDFRFVNDASAFALGECIGGAARNADRVLALTLGTGVGSGFVAGRKLVESGDEVPANGWVYSLPFEGTIVDDSFSTRWICRRYKELTGEEVRGAKDVADRYADSGAARRLFDEYGGRLAQFAVPVMERFRADALVLGGNISRAYPLFGGPMKAVMDAMGCDVKVLVSSLMDKAALTGAASLFA